MWHVLRILVVVPVKSHCERIRKCLDNWSEKIGSQNALDLRTKAGRDLFGVRTNLASYSSLALLIGRKALLDGDYYERTLLARFGFS
jgi:hypothetical protein